MKEITAEELHASVHELQRLIQEKVELLVQYAQKLDKRQKLIIEGMSRILNFWADRMGVTVKHMIETAIEKGNFDFSIQIDMKDKKDEKDETVKVEHETEIGAYGPPTGVKQVEQVEQVDQVDQVEQVASVAPVKIIPVGLMIEVDTVDYTNTGRDVYFQESLGELKLFRKDIRVYESDVRGPGRNANANTIIYELSPTVSETIKAIWANGLTALEKHMYTRLEDGRCYDFAFLTAAMMQEVKQQDNISLK